MTDLAELIRRAAAPHIDPDAWRKLTKGWQITPITINGTTVGATMVRGPEIHLASWTRPKASARATARQILASVVDRYGYAKTTVAVHNSAGLAFCRRLGFEVDGQTDSVYHLTCKEPRHA
jgi:hypothetical protein